MHEFILKTVTMFLLSVPIAYMILGFTGAL